MAGSLSKSSCIPVFCFIAIKWYYYFLQFGGGVVADSDHTSASVYEDLQPDLYLNWTQCTAENTRNTGKFM